MEETPRTSAQHIGAFLVNAAMGVVILLVNFPRFLGRMIDINVADPGWRDSLHAPIRGMQMVLLWLIGTTPATFFQRVMTCDFVLLGIFLALLAVFSLRRTDIRLLVYGVGGLVIGYVALHAIAWVALIIVTVASGVFYVARWLTLGLGAILAFIFHYSWPVFAAALLAAIAYGLYRIRHLILEYLVQIGQVLLVIAGGAVLLALVALLFRVLYEYVLAPIGRFLVWLLAPVVHVFVFILKWLVIAVAALFVTVVTLTLLAIVGNLVVAQILAGWYAGYGRKGVLLAGFAIGSAIALITLVAIATPAVADSLNAAWSVVPSAFDGATAVGPRAPSHFATDIFLTLLPGSVREFVFLHLANVQAPAFDSFILLVLLGLSCLSVAFKLVPARPSAVELVPVRFLPKEYFIIIAGLLLSVIMIFAAAESGDSTA